MIILGYVPLAVGSLAFFVRQQRKLDARKGPLTIGTRSAHVVAGLLRELVLLCAAQW